MSDFTFTTLEEFQKANLTNGWILFRCPKCDKLFNEGKKGIKEYEDLQPPYVAIGVSEYLRCSKYHCECGDFINLTNNEKIYTAKLN